jgi:hypothetical protein
MVINIIIFLTGLLTGVLITSLAAAQCYKKGFNDGRAEEANI